MLANFTRYQNKIWYDVNDAFESIYAVGKKTYIDYYYGLNTLILNT